VASRAALTVLVVSLGVANAFALFGAGPFNPTNIAWIYGDTATYYTGWALYRHDPHLRFPLAWTDRVGYPIGTSIGLLDAVPLVAVALRPLGPLLPEPFQYLGPYMALCFALQAWFGFRLCRRLFPSHASFAALGSMLFVLAPPMTQRAFGHVALMSQWTIVAALDAYFRDPEMRPTRWMVRPWIVLAIAAGLNPYIGVMCLLVTAAGIARLLLERRCGFVSAALLVLASAAIFVGSSMLFGSLVAGGAASYDAGGYGQFSLNLNAPANPMQYGSLVLPPLRLAHPFQQDGYNYLGFGVIVLCVIALAVRPESVVALKTRRYLPLAGLALVCTALAVSTTVTFGAARLFTLHLPRGVESALATLRASGRLFWPVHYLIIAGALSLACRAWRPAIRMAIVALLLAVQLADLTPLRREVRRMLGTRFDSPLQAAAWKGLGRKYDHLVLIPANQCDPNGGAGGVNGYVWFGELAASERMTTNSYYAARYSGGELSAHCVDLLRPQLDGHLDARSAYVVSDGVLAIWALSGLRPLRCEMADGFNLCTAAGDAAARGEPLPVPGAPAYPPGEVLDFRLRKTVRKYMTFGWGNAESGGTWTIGPLAMVRLGLEPSVQRERGFVLEVEALPFLAPSQSGLDVDILVNGQPIDRWTFTSPESDTRRARVPPSVRAARDGLDIEFRFPRLESPHAPFFGLKIRSLAVKPE